MADNPVKTEEDIDREFAEEFNRLCQEKGRVVIGVPRFVATNHGTYELVIDLVVQRKT